ncbi:MAG: hypothetical protein V7784_07695 [Oceanospirillaceae bacterium]
MASVLNFFQSASDDVFIDKMQLAGDIVYKQQVLLAIETQLCAQFDDTNIVIIKKLDVADTKQVLAAQITRQALQLKNSAVSGLSAQAGSAAAVYFTDSFELELALITDLLKGHQAWYWQSWHLAQQDKRQAIKECLLQNILQLPKLLQALTTPNLAHDVLSCLDHEDVKELIEGIYVQTQWSRFFVDEKHTKHFNYNELSYNHAVNSIPKAQLKTYQALLNSSADKHLSDTHNSELCHLFIILLAWQYHPQLMLNAQHQQQWFAQLFSYFNKDITSTKPANQDNAELSKLTEAVDTDLGTASKEAIQTTIKPADKNAQVLYHLSEKVGLESENILQKSSAIEQVIETPKQLLSSEEHRSTTDNELQERRPFNAYLDTAYQSNNEQFYSHCAGFYFIINILRQEEYQIAIVEQQLNPWHILYRLSQRLNLPLDGALQIFLANKLQLEGVDELHALSHFPQESQWSSALLKSCNISLADLSNALQIYGRVVTSTGYLDVYFHDSAIDINIRIAGLDINPTWLPWLGLVVNFHYLDDSRLLAADTYQVTGSEGNTEGTNNE